MLNEFRLFNVSPRQQDMLQKTKPLGWIPCSEITFKKHVHADVVCYKDNVRYGQIRLDSWQRAKWSIAS